MRVGVMGCGGMGKKRIAALEQIEGVEYIGVSDEARYLDYATLEDLLLDKPDWILVCLPHDIAVTVAHRALLAGVNVFMEKPMGRNLTEATLLYQTAKDERRQLYVGMNYRFYPGVVALMADLKAGWFGNVISVEMTLGHGGKAGDEKSWKLDPERAGGGASLDPGVHLLDLYQQFGFSGRQWSLDAIRGFWNTGIEEEARVAGIATTPKQNGVMVSLTSSIVRWRNTFKIEVNGTEGYGVVERRGGNYGPQFYRRGRRWGWMNSGSHWPEDWVVRQANCESVFADELRQLFFPKKAGPQVCTSAEALETMQLYQTIRDQIVTIDKCKTTS